MYIRLTLSQIQLSNDDSRVARMKDMLGKGGVMPGLLPPKPRPKPKAKPKPVVATPTRESHTDGENFSPLPASPDMVRVCDCNRLVHKHK